MKYIIFLILLLIINKEVYTEGWINNELNQRFFERRIFDISFQLDTTLLLVEDKIFKIHDNSIDSFYLTSDGLRNNINSNDDYYNKLYNISSNSENIILFDPFNNYLINIFDQNLYKINISNIGTIDKILCFESEYCWILSDILNFKFHRSFDNIYIIDKNKIYLYENVNKNKYFINDIFNYKNRLCALISKPDFNKNYKDTIINIYINEDSVYSINIVSNNYHYNQVYSDSNNIYVLNDHGDLNIIDSIYKNSYKKLTDLPRDIENFIVYKSKVYTTTNNGLLIYNIYNFDNKITVPVDYPDSNFQRLSKIYFNRYTKQLWILYRLKIHSSDIFSGFSVYDLN